MNERKINELVSEMKSFSKSKYHKGELLNEYLMLQDEIVRIAYGENYVREDNKKIWDVYDLLKNFNQERNGIAEEELFKFKIGTKKLDNLIRAEISGYRGEQLAFRKLDSIQSEHIILRNIELSDGKYNTELDAIVITPKGITIVEVKNTSKDIYIDERGNYYRTGNYLAKDCNIADKLNLKERLLRDVLANKGLSDITIRKIVVFTNNRVKVECDFKQIETCYPELLVKYIDDFESPRVISTMKMNEIKNYIEAAENMESYLSEFDAEGFKLDFVSVLDKLENGLVKNENSNLMNRNYRDENNDRREEESSKKKENNIIDYRNLFSKKGTQNIVKYAAIAATAGVAVIVTGIAANIGNKII